jgi:uncharacterized protein (TIGR00369 family)
MTDAPGSKGSQKGDGEALPPANAKPNLKPNLGRPIHGFRRTVGYETKVWAERYAEITLTIDGRHDNSHGIVHGGIYATLLDAAFGHAVAFCGTPGRTRLAVTINLQITYMAPARTGVLTAIGRVLGVEGRVASCSGEVYSDDGTLCARGQASFLYKPGSEQPDGVPDSARRAPI